MKYSTAELIGVEVDRTRIPLSDDEPTTIVEMFERAARLYQKPDALNYKRDREWLPISSDEMVSRSRAIGAGLYTLGIRAGDRVAILSENRPEWTLSDAGSQFAAAIDVPIYPTLTGAQAAYIINDSEARVLLISSRDKFERVGDDVKQCPTLEQIVFFDRDGIDPKEGLTLAELEDRGREFLKENSSVIDEISHSLKPDDLATIIYTSGTTGEPKGVMLTQSNLVSNLIDSSNHLSFGKDDIVLSCLPLSHVFERLAMYMFIDHGMSVFYAESIEKLGDNLREVRPTIMTGVPRIYEKIYARVKDKAAEGGRNKVAILAWAMKIAHEVARRTEWRMEIPFLLWLKHRIADTLIYKKWRNAVGGRMRLFISGSAALPEDLGLMYLGAGIPIVQGYGLTETSPVITAGVVEDNRIGTVGRPIRNVEVRIAEDGEIEVRGPNVMIGYFNKPEATRAVFTDDGWFKTGDIGMLDSDGYLKITDRKKELLKTSGGKYIAPQPIEQRIKGSRFVNQIVLIGDGHKFPAALIVPDWEQLRSYADLKGIDLFTKAEFVNNPRIIDLFERQIDAMTSDLAQFEKVKRFALLEEEFTIDGGELTPTLKVKRRVINEKYSDVIEKIYEGLE